jgi:AraC family transcriptional regulator, transcriptional activator of pobA
MAQSTDIVTHSIEEDFESTGFSLKRLEDMYHKNNGAPDVPHRHDYYSIIFIEDGEGEHVVDFTTYTVEARTIYFLLPGQMHQVIMSREPKGWAITFTEQFLIRNAIPDKMINDLYPFYDYGQSPPLPVRDRDMPVYRSLVEQIMQFAQSIEHYKLEAVGSLVKLFLIQSNNHCSMHKLHHPQMVETGNHLLRNFKQLLDEHYSACHLVSDYASKMAVTADYLNKIVKTLTGKSAKGIIQSKLLTEAKRALIFTPVSNKELAFSLGFEEAAHFNNFFKKSSGQTPSEFRASVHLS